MAALVAAIVLGSGALKSLLALPQGRIVAPANNQNFGWIERAIAQCEAEAARNVDTLYFLVIPVVAPDGDQQAWLAKSNGTVGASVLLLGSQDTLDGLKSGMVQERGLAGNSHIDSRTCDSRPWNRLRSSHQLVTVGCDGEPTEIVNNQRTLIWRFWFPLPMETGARGAQVRHPRRESGRDVQARL